MKKFLKRYGLFLVLLAVNITVGIIWPKIGLKSLDLTKSNLMEMLSVLPPIFVLLGLLDVWVDRAAMIRFTGKGSGFITEQLGLKKRFRNCTAIDLNEWTTFGYITTIMDVTRQHVLANARFPLNQNWRGKACHPRRSFYNVFHLFADG